MTCAGSSRFPSGVELGDAVAVELGDAVAVALGDAVAVALGDAVAVALGDADEVIDEEGLADTLGVGNHW
tara:strand:- start:412 stop:621 length:210 start_codon:yes stop_codon:yes gene_type:complete